MFVAALKLAKKSFDIFLTTMKALWQCLLRK
jgi:hypothetical protein